MEEGIERSEELEVRVDWSSVHDRAAAHVNSQQVWLPAQNQVSQHSSMMWGGAHETPPLSEELVTVDDFSGRKSHFTSRAWPLVA